MRDVVHGTVEVPVEDRPASEALALDDPHDEAVRHERDETSHGDEVRALRRDAVQKRGLGRGPRRSTRHTGGQQTTTERSVGAEVGGRDREDDGVADGLEEEDEVETRDTAVAVDERG